MNPRERFVATMHYQPRDHCPWGEMGFWPETLERWHREGWPRDRELHDFLGFDWVRRDADVAMGFVPGFAEQILEESADYRLVRREDGVVARQFRGELSFHMPQWVAFPLTSRRDWERDIRPRLDPSTPSRYMSAGGKHSWDGSPGSPGSTAAAAASGGHSAFRPRPEPPEPPHKTSP